MRNAIALSFTLVLACSSTKCGSAGAQPTDSAPMCSFNVHTPAPECCCKTADAGLTCHLVLDGGACHE